MQHKTNKCLYIHDGSIFWNKARILKQSHSKWFLFIDKPFNEKPLAANIVYR